MKLTRLRIQQLPGIDAEFALNDLDPGINLVTGPNAIGKSSIIRALRFLISEPAAGDPQALAMNADFENGGTWTVRRTGRGYEWQRDGERAERPALPGRDSLHCYWLAMEDLVRVGDNDRQLMEQLRQALAGGYDLPALRTGEFELRPRIGNNEAGRLREAEGKRHDIESDYRNLHRREATLPELKERIEHARQARIRAGDLEKAYELLDVLGEREEIRTALEPFPACMEKLHGNDLTRLEELEREREQLQTQSENAGRTRQDAEEELQATGLEQARPEQKDLQARRKLLDDTTHRQSQLNGKREEYDRALAEEQRARASLGDMENPPQLEPDTIKRAEELATDLDKLRQQCTEAEARLQNAEKAPDDSTLTRYSQAIRALLGWLATGKSTTGKTAPIIAGVAGAVAAGIAAFAQVWMATAAGIVAVVASIWSLFSKGGNDAAEARRQFEKQKLDGPAQWNNAAVEQALESLQQQFDALRLNHQQALAAAAEKERLRRLQKEREAKEAEKRQLAEKIGFDPSLTALGLDHFVRQVEQYQRAAQQRRGIEQTIERMEEEIRESQEAVRQFLSQWHVNGGASPAELDAALNDLAERARRADNAVATMERMDTDLRRLTRDGEEREGQIAALYREAGLEPGDRRVLVTAIDQLDDWKEQQRRLQDNSVRESQCRRELADQPALIAKAENGERESLERDKEKAKAEAARHNDLVEECAQIEADVRSAGGSRALEQATAEVDQAKAALKDRMNEQLFAEAAQFLLDEVENEHHTEHEPEVLRDARERFQRFTHHAWDVSLSDNTLKARALKQNSLRELTELSSGTRMQLLLAVRLAWTRQLEQQLKPLPLFLDEALTTADEKRFAAVADSLETLARDEGRQVFYLSARRQELGLWEKVTGHRPHHIDLAAIRGRQAATTDDAYTLPQEQPVPDPEGKNPQQYAAELGVPPVQPMQPAAGLHLFHLLRDDLNLLHRLMQDWNVSTLGQLQSLLNSPVAAQAIPDADQRSKLTGRGHAAQAWINAWRQGRGKPVDRIALEQSGAVSYKYIEKLTALAEEKGGDAEAIIDALNNRAVSGFRTGKTQDLKEFFEREGYIDPANPLGKEDRARRTLLTAGDKAFPFDIRQTTLWLEAATPNL